MTAKSVHADFINLSDFSDKCRICLKNYNDMVDIFASGISSQMMEVTNIKISCNDSLPKNMCRNCSLQLKEFHKFQCLAKDSDRYLRTLLKKVEEISDPPFESCPSKNNKKRKRKVHRKIVRLKSFNDIQENSEAEKIYLILVTEPTENSGSQNEICVKDLDGEKDNSEVIDLCKSLLKNQSCDSSYLDDHRTEFYKTETGQIKENTDKDVYKVNLFIYDCSECNESFELEDLLIEHVTNYHKTQNLNSSFNYTCPVCLQSEHDRNIFIDHLLEHRKEGFIFSKVDRSGNHISLTKLEEEVFEVPKLTKESINRNRIFKINTNSFMCILCKKVESINSVHEHLIMCFPDYNKDDSPMMHTKYTCPACCKSWVDNMEAMNSHLASHKADNIFFVKVNESGESVDLTQEDIGYTYFEKAIDLLSSNNADVNCDIKTNIVKIQDFYSCVACDFKSDSATSLSEHYMEIHDEVMPTTKMPCPVCCKSFKFTDSEESVMFLDHLRNHKSEGIIFLKINKDGSVNGDADNCGLFSNLNELYDGKIRCSELEFISDVYVPEVFLGSTSELKKLSAESDEFNSLKMDVEDANRTNREYVCEKCGRKCFGRGNYKRHFMTHAEKADGSSSTPKRPSCSECSKTFSNRAALNEHKKHHGNTGSDGESGRKICEICGRRFSNNASLAKHRRLHATNRESSLLKCKICGRGFRRETALKKHVSHHLNPNYFECEVCKLPLPSSASLQRHKLWHQSSSNTYDCKVCEVSFLTKDRLTAHETHTGHHQDRKRFECNVCHERFFIGREFSQHIKLHPKYKMSECSLCGKRLSTMQSLMLHLSRHFESNSILCPHCGKMFFEERNYHRHLLTHKGVKPFSCDFDGCKKSFYTYFELNRHKKYHNNTRDFSCPYCPKSFHEANHLKVHIRTHTGERPYACPHCNKGFVTRTRCKQHINLIHQGVGCDLIQSNISKKVAVFEALETVV